MASIPLDDPRDPSDILSMTFFSADKLKPRRIEIDSSRIGSNSPEVRKRLDRIGENYEQLNLILAELESRFENDERLKAIDNANIDFESTCRSRKKRKWRPSKPRSGSKSKPRMTASVDPKKPR